MAVVDWNDVCARAAALKNAYYGIISGGAVQSIQAKTTESEREVRYHKTDAATLRLEMWAAEDACRAQQGLPKLQRRFAITAGSRRRCW